MIQKKAVVTGCAGFIGSHLAERLVSDGWTVTGIDAFRPYYGREDKLHNLLGLVDNPRFTLVEGDLATTGLADLIPRGGSVFHLAAQPGVRASFGDGFAQYLADNLLATQRLFEASLEAGAARVVWASSSSVYGNADAYPCAEQTRLQPRSPYGVTKRACEDLAEIYATQGLSVVGLRYFTVYGPRQRPDMATRRLCEAVLNGQTFPLYGDGSQSRDFTYVADAVDATVRAAEAPVVERVYNIGGGQEATLLEVIGFIEKFAGRKAVIVQKSVQPGDVIRTGADTSLAQRSLGWRPSITLEEGIQHELDWVISRNQGR